MLWSPLSSSQNSLDILKAIIENNHNHHIINWNSLNDRPKQCDFQQKIIAIL
uniref:Uncharacterized protein n=1 Tax=Medicago truncatula TaxID=3880 RepID=Q2HSX3_MEDTR|nr:hypothetical protein MtrDRAFT_AC150891g3v2 [Medicago truncatula]